MISEEAELPCTSEMCEGLSSQTSPAHPIILESRAYAGMCLCTASFLGFPLPLFSQNSEFANIGCLPYRFANVPDEDGVLIEGQHPMEGQRLVAFC